MKNYQIKNKQTQKKKQRIKIKDIEYKKQITNMQ